VSATEQPAALMWTVAQASGRGFSRSSNPMHMLGGAIAAADVIVVLSASIGTYVLRSGTLDTSFGLAAVTLLATLLTLNAMWLTGSYSRHVVASPSVQITRAAQGWAVVFLVLASLDYLANSSFDLPRSWVLESYVWVLFGLAFVRGAVYGKVRLWRRQGKLARTVAIVSLNHAGDDLPSHLVKAASDELRVLGIFVPHAEENQRNSINDLIALSRLVRIDDVIIAISGTPNAEVQHLVRTLAIIPTNVHVCPAMPRFRIASPKAGLVFGHSMLTVSSRPLLGWGRVLKRTEDILLSALALIILMPLLICIALLIKIDSPGPVLFRQKRLGFNNNIITIYKFRSMTHVASSGPDVTQARRQDPRVTRVGRIIRRTSIDELPQLINVIQDRMSLVGPRPHALAHNDQYASVIDGYLGRHRVQPGITGLAQVNGFRGETDTLNKMQGRVEFDLAYIDNWSPLLDLRILFRTVIFTLLDRNAY
jgi:Undecaprenyl-phosphate glucose phosphotransferase